MTGKGTVYLVGAGPGDPGLITVRGAALVGAADVVIFDGLVGDGLLELPKAEAELIYAGKKRTARGGPKTQAEISELIVERALAGKSVVRLKGGDPMVFGRVAEELEALQAAGIDFEIVPGVSSLTAAPAYAGIPITRRGVASTVAFATGHPAKGRSLSEIDFSGFAGADTVVLFMAVSTLADCTKRLIESGRAAETPAAAIYWGTTAAQRTISSTLGGLAAAADRAGLKPPALIVIGDVAKEGDRFAWRSRRPLAGARVLIGRPQKQAEFAAHISRLGGEPLIAPLTRLVATDGEVRAQALTAISQPTDWLLFSSANAVERFCAALLEAGRDLRHLGGVRIGCVGKTTEKALRAIGLQADLVPEERSSKGLAEALLASPHAGGHAVIVRADGGRDDAETILTAAGMTATAALLYRSVAADPNETGLARALARAKAGEIDVAPLFAPSQVDAFCDLAGDEALGDVAIVAAIGKTTAAAIERRGRAADVIASSPSSETFAEEIAAAFQKRKTNS